MKGLVTSFQTLPPLSRNALLVLSMATAPTQPSLEVRFQFKRHLSSALLLNWAGSLEQLQQVATGQGMHNHRDPLLHSSGGWMPRSRCWRGWFLRGLGEHLLHAFCSFWLPPATHGLYCNLSGLPPSSNGLLSVMTVCHNSPFFLFKDPYFVFLVYNCVCVRACTCGHACVLWEHVCVREQLLGVHSHRQPVKAGSLLAFLPYGIFLGSLLVSFWMILLPLSPVLH